jgi:steroid delta-isomerase-like uncharacterized protein
MATDNDRLARRWFEEVWNQRRTETVYELLTPDSICQSEAGPLRGPEAFLDHVYRPFVAAFPDLRVTVEATVSDGDDVVVRWRVNATHTGDALPFPRTGRRVTVRGMTWIRYRDGKMAEGWDCWNQTGLIEALRTGRSSPSVSVT